MAETPSHKRAKGAAAGQSGKKELPLSRGRRLDAATPSKATEIERSGSMSNLEKAARRLKGSGKPQKVLQVPRNDMDKAAEAMRSVGIPGYMTFYSGNGGYVSKSFLDEDVEVRTTVPDFVDNEQFSFADICIDNYANRPVTYHRRLFFLKPDIVWVTDQVQAKEDVGLQAGQNWWIQKVSPLRGDTWVDGYRLPGETNLLFAFPLDSKVTVEDRWEIEPEPKEWLRTHAMLMPQRWLIRQNAPGDVLKAGHSVHFSAVLVPHAAAALPEPIARAIRFLVNTPSAGAVRIERANTVTFLAMGRLAEELADVRTDGDLLALVTEKGSPVSLFARNATKVRFGGRTLAQSTVRATLTLKLAAARRR